MENPTNRFKAALKRGERQIGFWNTIPDPSVVEALSTLNYDWLLIDTEHTPIDPPNVMSLLQAAAPYDVTPIVRPVVNDTALIKRYLDIGAQTLLVPFVQTVDEAKAAVAACRYAPEGVRGIGGSTRASRFGQIKDYATIASSEICLLVQVETVEAMKILEKIAKVDGIDGVFIGPGDLSASMGLPGQANHPKVVEACLDAIKRLKKIGVPAGILCQDDLLAKGYIDAGALFTAVGVDLPLLVRGAETKWAGFL